MNPLKSAVQKMLRAFVEGHGDYLLRLASIKGLRSFLDRLERECESIKVLDFPLWYMKVDDMGNGKFLLVREDVDVDILAWINTEVVTSFGSVSEWTHPEFAAFHREAVLIGNKASAPKGYLYSALIRGNGRWLEGIRKEMEARLGPSWKTCPIDVEGNVVRER